jgi:hypothetical protein
MSFKDVYTSLFNQIQGDSTLLGYMSSDDFIQGFRESLPVRRYMVIAEPGPERQMGKSQDYDKIVEVEYEIQLYCRILLQSTRVTSVILGNSNNIGLLDFTDDVKSAIRRDMSFSYNSEGQSLSAENVAGSFDLSATARYIAVSIDGRTPTGYDSIDCGSSTLSGDQVAANIQAALRSLKKVSNDGYASATCTFNSSTNQFTIKSSNVGPGSVVNVDVGASDDASVILGFDNPTETRGTNIIKSAIGSVSVENGAFPVRYRVVPVTITEEVLLTA